MKEKFRCLKVNFRLWRIGGKVVLFPFDPWGLALHFVGDGVFLSLGPGFIYCYCVQAGSARELVDCVVWWIGLCLTVLGLVVAVIGRSWAIAVFIALVMAALLVIGKRLFCA